MNSAPREESLFELDIIDDPPNEEETGQSRARTSKQVKCYIKMCILITVTVVAVVVIPGYYIGRLISKKSDVQKGSAANLFPWYTSKGKKLPSTIIVNDTTGQQLWPHEEQSDRIRNQLMFLPRSIGRVKTILLVKPLFGEYPSLDSDPFKQCPVSSCLLSNDLDRAEEADAILFSDHVAELPRLGRRPPEQVWILHIMKNPQSTQHLEHHTGLINWTATYRADSDIVTPFAMWVYYNESVKEVSSLAMNYAAEKTKKVVWFVKNCRDDHNGRRNYVYELKKYIDVDVFGRCSDHSCPCTTAEECSEVLNEYKFYLAFERVDCVDYITYKLFTSLQNDVVAVVMGARSQDYARIAPKNSYILADDFASPKELAQYLHKLDQHDDLYNAYFKYKGTGEVVDSKFLCRLCSLLHHDFSPKTYHDVDKWWRSNVCIMTPTWRDTKLVFGQRNW